jgi:hypothetical protein
MPAFQAPPSAGSQAEKVSSSVRPTFHDPDQYRACTRKRRFNTKRIAKEEAKRLSRARYGHPVSVYQCEYCSGWHLSQRQSKKEKKSHASRIPAL